MNADPVSFHDLPKVRQVRALQSYAESFRRALAAGSQRGGVSARRHYRTITKKRKDRRPPFAERAAAHEQKRAFLGLPYCGGRRQRALFDSVVGATP